MQLSAFTTGVRLTPVAVSCLLALAIPVTSRAQEVTPSATNRALRTARVGAAHTITKAPVIDGRLDDAEWKDGEPFRGFVQREQSEGAPATERTEIRFLTDGEALYIGAWLYDREPSGIVPGEKVRDVTLTNSDYVAIMLDTFHDKQNGFLFATTPAGIEYDGQIIREGEGGGVMQSGQNRMQAGSMGGFNLNWDGSWRVATTSDSLGWYAEFRIPFSTLRYGGAAVQTWGLNVARMIRRKNEESFWSFVPRQFNLYRMSLAGTLEGLTVPVRRVATVTPYVLGSATRDFVSQTKAKYPVEWGADMKYGLTPSLTLDLTYNTDFAQVEVDEQRTNLTRFPLFFPEKRPFFLENAGVFSAGTPQAVDLFFSRKIGIDNGTPVPIIGGGRLTGRVGSTTVGAMQIFTDDAPGGTLAGQSYTVLRALREVSRRSRIGVMGVQRMTTDSSGSYNRTFAVDGRVGLGDAWTIDWWGATTQTPNRSGDELGYSARAAYTTRDWNNSIRFLQIGEDFNPEVGFLSRPAGYRFYDVNFMRYVRKTEWASWFRQWNPHVNYRGYYGLDDFYQSGQFHLDFTEIEFSSGARFGPEVNVFHEGLQRPFEINPGDSLGIGGYDWVQLGLDWQTNPSANLSMIVRGDFGQFYTGTRNGGTVTITARSGPNISSSLLLDYQDVRLPDFSFTRSLVGLKAAYFFTPRIFIQSLTQFNNQQKIWTANARFGWLNTAGTGLFVVFNDGEVANSFFSWERPRSRSLVVKYTKQFGTGT
ncbi:MAG: carbohydrate binding family 9 domain-containing protein [Gemmatimonadetes bacterium]|nr:carbohydrate binding family 9 domain-containing protein [Gemmatimonadota bacterium]